MELKEGYKQTEVGVIPEDWEVKKLGQIGKFSKGQGIRKDDAQSGDIPCVRYGEIYTRHNDYVKLFHSFISKEIAFTSRKLKFGDILFAGSGETKEEIGKSVAFISNVEAFAGGDIVILSPVNHSPLFLGFLLNAPFIQKQKASRGQGDAIVHISATQLGDISIPIPKNLAEQTAIATALSDTDVLINSLEKLIAKKRNIKQGAMQKLLQPKEGWEVKKLGDVGMFKGGNGFPIIYQGLNEGKFPFFKVSDMNNEGNSILMKSANNWISEATQKENSMFVFPSDSIIFAKIGAAIFLERKKILISNGCIDNNMMGFILDEKKSDYRYFYYLFHTIKLSALVSTTALPSLSGKEIANLTFEFPTKVEQIRIATILSDMDAEIAALETKLVKYRNIKLGMMQQLLTGKIRLVGNC